MEKVLEILAGWDASRVLALINAVGGPDIAHKLISGEMKVHSIGQVIQADSVTKQETPVEPLVVKVVPADRVLVDKNGRCIPFKGIKGEVVDANRAFYLTQPKIGYVAVRDRLQKLFCAGDDFMSAEELRNRCEDAIKRIHGNVQVANLLKGPHFPFVLPQFAGDLGKFLDDTLVPMLERAYRVQFPNRSFTNYRHGTLVGEVKVALNTRQDRLVDAMAKGPVCGVCFPTATQGFGIQAVREFITHLPEDLILSGMEVPVAAAAYPDVFGRDYQTPGLDMASLVWRSGSLCFEAYDVGAFFDYRSLRAYDRYSGGVSVLG
ncbi:MAG: hypothetical protein WCT11_04735 [Candidatus Magasanikbacteria bacterium]